MKISLFTLTLIVVSSISFFAQAEPPRIEPGPEITMDAAATEATDALLMATSENLKQFVKSGNQILNVTRKNWQPGITIYRFSRKQCTHGGAAGKLCLSGSDLEVVIKEVRIGTFTKISATSKVYLNR